MGADDEARKFRRTAAILLIIGFIFPVLPSLMGGSEHVFTWELLGKLGEEDFLSKPWLVLMFIGLAPFLGAAVLLMEAAAGRRGRAIGCTVFGGLMTAAMISMMGESNLVAQQGFMGVLGILMVMLIVVGSVVAVRRPDREVGYRLAGLGGSFGLILSLLPISPDLSNPGEMGPGILTIFRVLEVDKIGFPLFVVGITGLAIQIVAVTLWAGGARAGRAKLALVLAGVYALLNHIVPLYIAVFGGVPAWPVIVLLLAFLTFRIIPILAVFGYGIADLILQKVPEKDWEEAFK